MLATWHAYAKLQLHTDQTLAFFKSITISLGKILRKFVDITCAAFKTKELPKEVTAQVKRAAAQAAKTGGSAATSTAIKSKTLNLSTYKLHADYFAYCSPEDHHHITQSQKDFHILSGWLSSHSDDPAIAERLWQLETRY